MLYGKFGDRYSDYLARRHRAKRGYVNSDVWSYCDWFLEMTIPMLDKLKNEGIGYPGIEGAATEEEWKEILETLIVKAKVLQYYLCNPSVYDYELECLNNAKDEFFALFSKWFFYLWD